VQQRELVRIMRKLPLIALLAALAASPSAHAALHPRVYFQIVTPLDNDVVKQTSSWTPAVKGNFQHEVTGVVAEISKRFDPDDQPKISFNPDLDAKKGYQPREMKALQDGAQAISVSVLENTKSNGRLTMTVDVYFGGLKGALADEWLMFDEKSSLASSDRAVTELKYMFLYAWAMDFISQHSAGAAGRLNTSIACQLFNKARTLESNASVQGAGLAPLRAALAKSAKDAGCPEVVSNLNGH
jgi:hypothetical protein